MRWLTFLLVTVALLTLQTSVAPRFALFGVRPDWLLVSVVFFALHAPVRDALPAAWIMGAGADLMTVERFGLISLSFVVACALILATREYLFRHRWVTQMVVTLSVCVLIRVGWLLYRYALYDPASSVWAGVFVDVILVSMYTSLWVVPFHRGLRGMSRAMGVSLPRYTYPGLHRTDGAGV